MSIKHTQGEWRKLHHMFQDGSGGDKFYEIRSDAGKLIAKMPGWTEEDAANAALVKAASKLLTALEAVLPYAITGIEELRRLGPSFLKDVCEGKAATEAADAAIREATP